MGWRTKETYLLGLLALSSVLGSSVKTSLLLLLGLGTVLVKKLEELGGGVLVEGVRELSDGRRNLQALGKDDLLTLKADVFGPLHEAGEVGLRPDVLTCNMETPHSVRPEPRARRKSQIESRTDTEVFGTRLEERVLRSLGGLAGTEGRSGGLLTGSGLGLGRLVASFV